MTTHTSFSNNTSTYYETRNAERVLQVSANKTNSNTKTKTKRNMTGCCCKSEEERRRKIEAMTHEERMKYAKKKFKNAGIIITSTSGVGCFVGLCAGLFGVRWWRCHRGCVWCRFWSLVWFIWIVSKGRRRLFNGIKNLKI